MIKIIVAIQDDDGEITYFAGRGEVTIDMDREDMGFLWPYGDRYLAPPKYTTTVDWYTFEQGVGGAEFGDIPDEPPAPPRAISSGRRELP